MKKCVLILVCALLVCLCSLALAQEVTLSLPGKNASVNAGMTYDVTISADAPVATATDFVLTCADIGFSAAGQIPAGEQETTVKVDIPADKGGGNRITFALEGQTTKHQVQVYSLPNVQFYIEEYVSHPGHEVSVLAVCRNPSTVLSANNVFELRNQFGQVLDTAEWSNPNSRLMFTFTCTKELLGKQILSVYLNGVCVTQKEALLFVSDYEVPRVKTLNPSTPSMSITLDCGAPSIETPQQTTDVLAVLDKYNVKATFFMTGQFIQSQLESALRIRDAGHEIANHTYSHPPMTTLSPKEMQREVMRVVNLLEEHLGVTPRLFRPPYGDTNEKVTAVVRGEGMEEIMWTIDSYDWKEGYGHSNIIERVTNENTLVDGSVILFHLDGFNCAETLDIVIPYYQNEKGFECVPVSELLRRSGRELPPMPSDREALVYAPATPTDAE